MNIAYRLAASIVALVGVINANALSNTAKVPVLLYHAWQLQSPCNYANNAGLALESDLQTIKAAGFTVVPLYWIAEWAAGVRDGSTLPSKVVGIAFDDGHELDWKNDPPSVRFHPCRAQAKSFQSVLNAFKFNNIGILPSYSPHASTFVIGSPVARQLIGGGSMPDDWWAAANSSSIMEVYNHGSDHDHSSITSAVWDPAIGAQLAIGGYGDGLWSGQMNFMRIDSYTEANFEIAKSATVIAQKISPAWPDLFAYPFGHASSYLKDVYFPNYWSEHKTFAAFTTEQAGSGAQPGNYVRRGLNRYALPRLSFGYSWTSPAQLSTILAGAN